MHHNDGTTSTPLDADGVCTFSRVSSEPTYFTNDTMSDALGVDGARIVDDCPLLMLSLFAGVTAWY